MDYNRVILGSAIGPVIGGYVDQYLGWRWIFYLKTIIGGVITILAIVFVQETFYRPGKNMPATSFREHLERFKFNPVSLYFFFLKNIYIYITLF